LSEKFDQLFRTKTGYDKLDERFCKTKENKKHLLYVLKKTWTSTASTGFYLRTRKNEVPDDKLVKPDRLNSHFIHQAGGDIDYLQDRVDHDSVRSCNNQTFLMIPAFCFQFKINGF